jgi:hypothetical protein
MKFDVAGPFEIPRFGKKRIITKESLRQLKQLVESHQEGLSDACGCYVFALRAGKGWTPHYVGQACKLPILGEALRASSF